jgi:hypothetical protein
MKLTIIAAVAAMLAGPVLAGNLVTTGLDDPHVTPPATSTTAFSWSGPYAGVSYGQSSHTRTYEHREEEPWEKHAYRCDRGTGHFGFKCDVTGLTHAPEFGTLNNINRPWSNARDETVRYNNGYDGLWMGADQSFAFTLPSYVAPVARDSRWAQIGYEHMSGVNVTQWTETVTESDTTLGGFVGYRHQFQTLPFVVGAEFNAMTTDSHGDFTQIGLQAGFAAGRVLPYVEAGADHYAGGVDVALGRQGRLLVGVRTWEAHDGDDKGTQLRVGWNF